MPEERLEAGPFGTWLDEMRSALADEVDADVPCGHCTACCESSQFVHVGPDERDALAHIPPDFLFPAPLRPAGHMLMGYDDDGRCPMLSDSGCTIYEHRPRTCRTFDCRVFAAAGVEPDADKPKIVERVRRWEFDTSSEADRRLAASVRSAATFAVEQGRVLPSGGLASPNAQALFAVEMHDRFVDGVPVELEDRTPGHRRD
jgi:Fe-S-cluster containining protein